MALLALLIVVNPSQASGFTGEGSGLHVGDECFTLTLILMSKTRFKD